MPNRSISELDLMTVGDGMSANLMPAYGDLLLYARSQTPDQNRGRLQNFNTTISTFLNNFVLSGFPIEFSGSKINYDPETTTKVTNNTVQYGAISSFKFNEYGIVKDINFKPVTFSLDKLYCNGFLPETKFKYDGGFSLVDVGFLNNPLRRRITTQYVYIYGLTPETAGSPSGFDSILQPGQYYNEERNTTYNGHFRIDFTDGHGSDVNSYIELVPFSAVPDNVIRNPNSPTTFLTNEQLTSSDNTLRDSIGFSISVRDVSGGAASYYSVNNFNELTPERQLYYINEYAAAGYPGVQYHNVKLVGNYVDSFFYASPPRFEEITDSNEYQTALEEAPTYTVPTSSKNMTAGTVLKPRKIFKIRGNALIVIHNKVVSDSAGAGTGSGAGYGKSKEAVIFGDKNGGVTIVQENASDQDNYTPYNIAFNEEFFSNYIDLGTTGESFSYDDYSVLLRDIQTLTSSGTRTPTSGLTISNRSGTTETGSWALLFRKDFSNYRKSNIQIRIKPSVSSSLYAEEVYFFTVDWNRLVANGVGMLNSGGSAKPVMFSWKNTVDINIPDKVFSLMPLNDNNRGNDTGLVSLNSSNGGGIRVSGVNDPIGQNAQIQEAMRKYREAVNESGDFFTPLVINGFTISTIQATSDSNVERSTVIKDIIFTIGAVTDVDGNTTKRIITLPISSANVANLSRNASIEITNFA